MAVSPTLFLRLSQIYRALKHVTLIILKCALLGRLVLSDLRRVVLHLEVK